MDGTLNIISHKEFLDSLIAGNRVKCSAITRDYLGKGLSIEELYEKVFKEALYDVGELWERNKISVATEHLASAIVESLLNETYSNVIGNDRISNTVIVSCVENEFHQIGIKMVSDVFEMNGWNSYFLGANTPTNELVSFAKKINPDVFALSLSIYFHLPILEKMVSTLRCEFPEQPILVGGQAFRQIGQDFLMKYNNVLYRPDLNSIDQFIKNFSKNG